MTSSNDFHRLETLFHELAGLDATLQAQRLQEIAAEDAELHDELVRLLEPSTILARDEQQLDQLAGAGGLSASLTEHDDPEQIGNYKLTALLGEGGMGRVYLAEQSDPVQRKVALKLIRLGSDSSEAKARFNIERQALALLDHPHIARVFDAGSTEDGRPWFAMEYIDGKPITQWAREQGLSLIERIRLLLPVCEAVQYAHRKGLIHRDLKPSNILVVDDGLRGFPKVIDFGIARVVDLELDQRSQRTRFGELIGTPEYMSPEQAALGSIDIDTRSDVYSLGLVLYELLVGALPISGQELRLLGFEAMCRQIREGDTPKPSRYRGDTSADTSTLSWRARLKGDLDSVLLKALSKDRERRYGSAAELADDLCRYLESQPVLAQPPSFSYRAAKFSRRNRVLVSAASIAILALISGTIISSYGLIEARNSEQRALLAAQQEQQARLQAEQNLARSEFFLGRANLYNLAQNAYSDVLQRLFGNEADVERQTRVLLDRVAEAHARRQEEPKGAALLSFAVGRHFLFRNDYPTALQVLEPWIAEAYGPEELLFLGRMLLPVIYINLGRSQDAIPALRQNIAEFAASWEANSPDHVAAATQLASITGSAEDLMQAEQVLAVAMQTDHGPQINMYFANQLALMRRYRGDLDGAHQALQQLVEIIDANALINISGTDTGKLNLASFELYHADDPDRAEALVQTVLETITANKGQSRESGRARELLGVIRAGQGDYTLALSLLQQAVNELERFGGPSQALVFGLASLAETQVSADQSEAAEQTLARADSAMPAQDRRNEAALRVLLAKAWWLQATRGNDNAIEFLRQNDIDIDLINTNPVLLHRYAMLTADQPDALSASTDN